MRYLKAHMKTRMAQTEHEAQRQQEIFRLFIEKKKDHSALKTLIAKVIIRMELKKAWAEQGGGINYEVLQKTLMSFIPHEQVRRRTLIGSGSFGLVWLGDWHG